MNHLQQQETIKGKSMGQIKGQIKGQLIDGYDTVM